VLANTHVLFVALVGWLVLRERAPGALTAALLAFAGVVLVTGVGQPAAYGEAPVLGTLFGLGSGITYAAFLLIFRRAGRGQAAWSRTWDGCP
jgi:drug/metabolite transporter (DMT)-like permease